jgi:hypothetical protein
LSSINRLGKMIFLGFWVKAPMASRCKLKLGFLDQGTNGQPM